MSGQDKDKILDEAMDGIAGMVSGGLSLASGAGAEAKALLRTKVERLVTELDLVNGERLEVAQAQINQLRARVEELEKSIKAAKGDSK